MRSTGEPAPVTSHGSSASQTVEAVSELVIISGLGPLMLALNRLPFSYPTERRTCFKLSKVNADDLPTVGPELVQLILDAASVLLEDASGHVFRVHRFVLPLAHDIYLTHCSDGA